MRLSSIRWIVPATLGLVSLAAQNGWAQPLIPGGPDREQDWRWGFYLGWLDGVQIGQVNVGGENFDVDSETAWLVGLRGGEDREYWGWDVSFGIASAEIDVEGDPFATGEGSDEDLDLYLLRADAYYYPTGHDWGEGRVRPYLSAGPGIGWFTSDFDEVDGKVVYDASAGLGIKWLLGDEGQTSLQLDYRWHFMEDFNRDLDNMWRQEVSLGMGFRF